MVKKRKECYDLSLTNVVPAASSGGAAGPSSLELVDLPVALCAVGQGVGGHVADLHPAVVPLEVLKLHPGVQKNTIIVICHFTRVWFGHIWPKTRCQRAFKPFLPLKV